MEDKRFNETYGGFNDECNMPVDEDNGVMPRDSISTEQYSVLEDRGMKYHISSGNNVSIGAYELGQQRIDQMKMGYFPGNISTKGDVLSAGIEQKSTINYDIPPSFASNSVV